MSRENIVSFYQLLEKDSELQKKAMALQQEFQEQEDVIDAFIAMAEDLGYPFTFREFMEYMYERAKES